MMTKCRICESTNQNEIISVKEMQLGTREIFDYFLCKNCGCLQIKDVPKDLDPYYPENYYSYNLLPLLKNSKLSKFVALKRTQYNLFGKGFIGRILAAIHPNELLKTISESNIKPDAKVLDVGCGRGHTLYTMSTGGMSNLLGIDPYLPGDITYENGLKILKKSIDEIHQNFDLIMLNHVFEHIEHQLDMLINIQKRLNDGGTCIIRIPTVSSYAWENYKSNWVQLDAPRHLFIHSLKSIEYLVQKCDMQIYKIKFDSEAFQFIGSEQYMHDIALNDSNSYVTNRQNSIFSPSQIKSFSKKAAQLNSAKKGDQIAVFIRKK